MPEEEELGFLSVTAALAAFRSRELSPVELLEALIRRGDAAAETCNPFSARYSDEALAAARESERRYRDGTARPLEGIAVAVKELTPMAGHQHTLGSLVFRDRVAEETAPMVQRLLDAGVVVHARTTTPEFGCATFTHSRLYGATSNPWNRDFSPGGSSGGAAAALATGTTTLATGSDSAGSLRLPAAACGVVGFKPSFGVVPVAIPQGLETTKHEGPMAREVEDVALAMELISGPSPDAPNQTRPALELPDLDGGVTGWRVGRLTGIAGLDIDPDVDAGVDAAARALEDAGAVVETVDLGWSYEEIEDAMGPYFAATYGPTVQRLADSDADLLTPYALNFASKILKYAARPGFVIDAQEGIAKLWKPLQGFFADHQLLVCPTLAMPAPELEDEFLDHGPLVAGREQPDWLIVGTTVPFNLCPWSPAINVPAGFAAGGIPVGAQLVGRPYADSDVLQAAKVVGDSSIWPGYATRRPAL